jgi:hypothetical protein
MPKFKMLVFSNVAKGGDEANYNKWYNEQHIPDVCNVPGFTGAQRFKRSGDEGPAQYLAIYEMDAEDPAAVVAELTSRAGTDKMVMTDDIDLESATIMMYEQVSEPYTA